VGARTEHHALEVVQAAYALEGGSREWMQGLLDAAQPALDHGLGLLGVRLHLGSDGRPELWDITSAGDAPDGLAEMVSRYFVAVSADQFEFGLRRSYSAAAEEHARHGRALRDWAGFPILRAVGARDVLGLNPVDPTGRAFMIAALMPEERTVSPAERARWDRVGIHVLAGMRLREGASDLDGEAVVDSRGRVVHAVGEARSARDALRRAAAVIDRARSSAGRRDPDAALEAWRGLVSGRWSLVDRFDRDGRRYLVARRNDPRVCGPAALTERQRQILAHAACGLSNKEIAYALGLAPSTVSTHLRNGMRALGLRDHAALAALFRPAPPADPPAGSRGGG